ncbi:glucan biosynthesis protein G [Alloalcanivorax mobilis]|uniref:glucan biosynthesis protein G n=1 Tax=Alloalcanivorax mobilis TaxID=2019569 RepID=UPI001E29DB8A|nr:glucan biosynthesis protein G [Alloalcanivorax mobilis]
MKRYRFALASCLLTVLVMMLPSLATAFDFDDVIAEARGLADQAYKPPPPVPQFLQDLNYDQYQGIRFKPQNSLWAPSKSRFQVMLVSPGLFFKHAVRMHVIDAQGLHDIDYDKSNFTFDNEELSRRVPADLGYAGFKLTYPMHDAGTQNQFLVFAGASYFRAVGRDNAFGLSARGIAVDTGLPSGEQFPSFTEFWLVRPAAGDEVVSIYALLDGRRLTGAYRFDVRAGDATVIDVKARLFPRDGIQMLGIAPLTSMFFYGSNTGRPLGEWRPRVHDSDGLLIQNGGSGEWLWRPLLNPAGLKMDYFLTENVRGFGLMQRQERFEDFADFGAKYQDRPSAWVAPQGDWGKGRITLVQLPTRTETNDNIVAFWTPMEPVTKNQTLSFDYRLTFGDRDIAGIQTGQALDTYVGDGNKVGGGNSEGAYRVIIDFGDGVLDSLSADAAVTSNVTAGGDGEVIEHFVEYLAPVKRWRLSILARPAEGQPLQLRAFLKKGEDTVSETWSYEIPVNNDILGGRR